MWLSRIIFGATFIISGWAKGVDPWGTVYKIQEYFTVWHLDFTNEITLILAVALAVFEFTLGVCIFLGLLRRMSAWTALAVMCVMLPLTIYIFAASPVSDCGCFGDFLVISNAATMWKNVALIALAIVLVVYNRRCEPVILPEIQWLALTVSIAFVLCLSWIGYQIQPPVDFRPYGEDTVFCSADENEGEAMLIYEKNGERKEFSLNDLPDSTWTFVEQADPGDASSTLTVFDGGEDVTADVLCGGGRLMVVSVPNPGVDDLYGSRNLNRLADYIRAQGGDMIGLVAADGDRLQTWSELANPSYPVYSAEDTSLKELVRGQPGVVYADSGKIVWKRTLNSLSANINSLPEQTDSLEDQGRMLAEIGADAPYNDYLRILVTYLIAMFALVLMSLPGRLASMVRKSLTLQKMQHPAASEDDTAKPEDK